MTTMDTYNKVAKAIQFFVENQASQPGLKDISAYLHLSEYHLQRLFSDWVGVSPKQFLQFLTKESAKVQLARHSVVDASYRAGLSGSGRLHDLLLRWEGVTPGEYKTKGAGLDIIYGHGPSPFGCCFIAQTKRGICQLAFYDADDQFSFYEDELKASWCGAKLIRDDEAAKQSLYSIFPQGDSFVEGGQKTLRLLMKGTPFQVKVWEALLTVPEGQVCTYQDIANGIGSPSSVRAVASAIARNNIGFLIPCHRVIRSTGAFSNYRWGVERKMAMIGWEASKAELRPCEQVMAKD